MSLLAKQAQFWKLVSKPTDFQWGWVHFLEKQFGEFESQLSLQASLKL